MNSFSTKEQRLLGFSGPEGFGQPREEPKVEKKEVNPLYAQVGENREEKHKATYDSIKDRTQHYKQEIDKLALLLRGAIENKGTTSGKTNVTEDATLTERSDDDIDPELEEAWGILKELGDLRQNAVKENFVKFEDLEHTYSKIEEVIRTLEAKAEKSGASFDANYDERMAAKRLAEFLTNGAQTTNLDIYNNEQFKNVQKSASEYRLRLPIDAEIPEIAHTNEGRASNGVHYITIQQNDLDAFMGGTPEKNMTIKIQGKDCPAIIRRNDAAGNVKITVERKSSVSALEEKSKEQAALTPKRTEPAPLSPPIAVPPPKEAPKPEPVQQPIEVAPVEAPAPKPPAATSMQPRAATFTQEDRMKQTVAPSAVAVPETPKPAAVEPPKKTTEVKVVQKVEAPVMKPMRKAEPKMMDVKAKPLNEQPAERKVEPQKIDVKVKEQPPKQAAAAPRAAQVLPVRDVPKGARGANFAVNAEEKPAVKPVRENAAAKAPAVQPKRNPERKPAAENARENDNAMTLDSFAKEIAKDPKANEWFAELQALMNIPTIAIPNVVFEEMDTLARKIGKEKLKATDADFKRLAPKNRKELLAFIDKVVEAGGELPGGQDAKKPPAETRKELHEERIRDARKITRDKNASPEEKAAAGFDMAGAISDMALEGIRGTLNDRLDGQAAKPPEKKAEKPAAAPKPKEKGEDEPRGEKAPEGNAVTLDALVMTMAKDPVALKACRNLDALIAGQPINKEKIKEELFVVQHLGRIIALQALKATDEELQKIQPKDSRQVAALIHNVIEAGKNNAERAKDQDKALFGNKTTLQEKADALADFFLAEAAGAREAKARQEEQPNVKKEQQKDEEPPKEKQDDKPLPPLRPRMAPRKFEEQRNPEFPEQQRTRIIEELKDINHDHSRFIKLDTLRGEKIDALWKAKDQEQNRCADIRNVNDREIPKLEDRTIVLENDLTEMQNAFNALNRENDPALNERRALAIRIQNAQKEKEANTRSLERKKGENGKLLVKEKQLESDKTLLNELRSQSKDIRELEAFEGRLQILKNDKVFEDCIITVDADNTLICSLTNTRKSFRDQAEKLQGVRIDGETVSFNLNVKYIIQKLGEEAIKIVEMEKRSQQERNQRAGK